MSSQQASNPLLSFDYHSQHWMAGEERRGAVTRDPCSRATQSPGEWASPDRRARPHPFSPSASLSCCSRRASHWVGRLGVDIALAAVQSGARRPAPKEELRANTPRKEGAEYLDTVDTVESASPAVCCVLGAGAKGEAWKRGLLPFSTSTCRRFPRDVYHPAGDQAGRACVLATAVHWRIGEGTFVAPTSQAGCSPPLQRQPPRHAARTAGCCCCCCTPDRR